MGVLKAQTRFYVDNSIDWKKGQTVPLRQEQRHKLHHVVRAQTGDTIQLFNGSDGEWLAKIEKGQENTARQFLQARLVRQLRPQPPVCRTQLSFGIVKQAALDDIMTKATELAVAALHPVVTEYAVVRQINQRRLRDVIIRAAEQSRRLDLPQLSPPRTLREWVADYQTTVSGTQVSATPLYVCDPYRCQGHECQEHECQRHECQEHAGEHFFIGPEGGFSAQDYRLLESLPSVVYIGLGDFILRSETAAAAVLARVSRTQVSGTRVGVTLS